MFIELNQVATNGKNLKFQKVLIMTGVARNLLVVHVRFISCCNVAVVTLETFLLRMATMDDGMSPDNDP